jgi:hypothetical protein
MTRRRIILTDVPPEPDPFVQMAYDHLRDLLARQVVFCRRHAAIYDADGREWRSLQQGDTIHVRVPKRFA